MKIAQYSMRLLETLDTRVMWKLAYNFGWKGMRSVQKFKKRLRDDVVFPPFLYISIINSCNLRCQGCWIDVASPRQEIDLDSMSRLIDDAKAHGNSFFGILGGEPFMHSRLLDILAEHPQCYFQIFTNGQFITKETADRLRDLGNATPLVSIEGDEIVSDQRRGRSDVLSRTLEGLDHCIRSGVLTGVATSVCRSNIDDLLNESWIDHLIERGAHYVWYHTYRPVGPNSSTELALTPDQLIRVRRFIVEMRCKKPIGIVDAYWDDQGKALCPAATGISHHIGPWGDIEPCPIVQFGRERIDAPEGIYKTMTESQYLKDFRDLARTATRGCIVLERPDLLRDLVVSHDARDTTARRTALMELEQMNPRHSQHMPGREIPEKSWAYRFMKKHWFFGFGAYS